LYSLLFPFLVLISSARIDAQSPSDASPTTLSVAHREAVATLKTDPAATIGKLKKLLASNPMASGHLFADLGTAYMAAQQYAEGASAFEEAARRGGSSPKFDANSTYNAACCYARAGDRELAWIRLRAAMSLGFRSLVELRADADLQSLHADKEWQELAATKDTASMSRDDAWRYDVWLLDREVRRIHYAPYRLRSVDATDAEYNSIRDSIPSLDDDEIVAALVKYMAGFGDGHTSIFAPGFNSTRLPIDFYWFEEGIYIRATDPEHVSLLGGKLISVEGVAIDDVVKRLTPYIPRDNDQWVKFFVPILLANPKMLHGIGLASSADAVQISFSTDSGKINVEKLSAIPATRNRTPGNLVIPLDWIDIRKQSGRQDPLSWHHSDERFWIEYLPEQKIVYCRIDAILNETNESFADFANRLYVEVDAKRAQALILDVRRNGGGNNTLLRPLIQGIIQRPTINQTGHLFVITGRQTFSACQNFVSRLERDANVMIVGEPSASKPNFIGESVPVILPYAGLRASVSDLFWEDGLSWDTRQWIAPELWAPPTLATYRENRDPAMEAIFGFLAAQNQPVSATPQE
jgi:Peptidase family S41